MKQGFFTHRQKIISREPDKFPLTKKSFQDSGGIGESNGKQRSNIVKSNTR